ncbi:MAG: helix-turn-helix domain-containing protein [Nanoarchaeota archaeon]|nr:helix-turn-helix domain-containing protein [Nanoarchaeota archaeon]
MDRKLIEELGFTENETSIYLSLLQFGESSANTVSEKTGLHRSYCYDTLSKMANKGLVSYSTKQGKKYFKGVHPKKFLDILKEKEEKVKELVPELLKLYNQEKSDYEIEILDGTEGMKTYHERTFSHLEKGEIPDLYEIGRKISLIDDYPMKYYFSNLIKRAEKMGFYSDKEKLRSKIRYLWDHSIKGDKRHMQDFSTHKYLPEDFNTYGIDLTIINDEVNIQNYEGKPFVITIRNKNIAHFFIQIFKQIWKTGEDEK